MILKKLRKRRKQSKQHEDTKEEEKIEPISFWEWIKIMLKEMFCKKK